MRIRSVVKFFIFLGAFVAVLSVLILVWVTYEVFEYISLLELDIQAVTAILGEQSKLNDAQVEFNRLIIDLHY